MRKIKQKKKTKREQQSFTIKMEKQEDKKLLFPLNK